MAPVVMRKMPVPVRIAGLPAHGWRGGMNLFSGGFTAARTGRAGGVVAITGSLVGDVDGGRRRACCLSPMTGGGYGGSRTDVSACA